MHTFHLLNNKYKAGFQQGARQQKLKVKLNFAQQKGYVRLKSTGKSTWDAIKTCRNNANPSRFATVTGLQSWALLVGSVGPRIYIDKYMQNGFKKVYTSQRQGYKAYGMTTRPDAKHYETLTLVTLTKVCTLDTSLPKTGHVLTKPLES